MTAPWLRIARSFPRGPSIPYILGALRTPIGAVFSDEASRAQLLDLLVTLRDAPEHVCVQRCPDLGAHIVHPVNGPEAAEGRPCIASMTYSGRALHFEPIPGYQIDTVLSLADALWDLYREPISAGTFSRSWGGNWHKFDSDERKRIEDQLNDG